MPNHDVCDVEPGPRVGHAAGLWPQGVQRALHGRDLAGGDLGVDGGGLDTPVRESRGAANLPRRTLIIADEAHLLPDASLEDLRLLTADEFDRKSPFAMILCGQPLLRERLAEPRHYALAQRIGVRIRLRPLTEAEMGLFVALHLKAAGATRAVFDPQATAAMFQHTRGIPRLVQNLALGSALAAMAAGKATVDAIAVQQALVDLEDL